MSYWNNIKEKVPLEFHCLMPPRPDPVEPKVEGSEALLELLKCVTPPHFSLLIFYNIIYIFF